MKQNDTAGCNFVVLAFSLHALSMQAIEEQSGFTVGAVSSRVCSRTGIADEAAREKVAICAPAHRNRQFVTPIIPRGCLFPGEASCRGGREASGNPGSEAKVRWLERKEPNMNRLKPGTAVTLVTGIRQSPPKPRFGPLLFLHGVPVTFAENPFMHERTRSPPSPIPCLSGPYDAARCSA